MDLDPMTAALAATALNSLTVYAQKGAEEFAKSAGKATFEQVQKLVSSLRRRFVGDHEAETALQNFEQKPEHYRSALDDILREKLAGDPAFVAELRDIVNTLGPSITVIQELGKAGTVIGVKAANAKSGNVDVYQSADEVENLTGVQIDSDIGGQ